MITHVVDSEKHNGLAVAKAFNSLNRPPIDSKVKFFRKENCKYHVQLFDDAKNVKELYELKVSFETLNLHLENLYLFKIILM